MAKPKVQRLPIDSALEQKSNFRAKSHTSRASAHGEQALFCCVSADKEHKAPRLSVWKGYTPHTRHHTVLSVHPRRAASADGVADTKETDSSSVPRPGGLTFSGRRSQNAACGAPAPAGFERLLVQSLQQPLGGTRGT